MKETGSKLYCQLVRPLRWKKLQPLGTLQNKVECEKEPEQHNKGNCKNDKFLSQIDSPSIRLVIPSKSPNQAFEPWYIYKNRTILTHKT